MAGWSFQSTRPVRGGTFHMGYNVFCDLVFQSTRPVRGGTITDRPKAGKENISIHPPRAGRDIPAIGTQTIPRNFNPPAPCGAGLREDFFCANGERFQSTRPMRGGTKAVRRCHFNPPDFNPPAPCGAGPLPWANGIAPARFQSTRPMRGGTAWLPVVSEHRGHFNPPAPCGAGLWPKDWGKGLAIFQSTRPMRGGTYIRAAARPR